MFSVLFAEGWFMPHVWFNNWDPGHFIGLVAVVGGIIFVTISVLTSHWRGMRIAEMEASLKQQMLDKGMSAAEIEQVLRRPTHPMWESCSKPVDDTPNDLPALVKLLADNEYSGEDIERLLRAVSADPLGRDVHGSDQAARAVFREKAATIKNLVENEMSAEDIERVLKTYPQHAANGVAATGAQMPRA